MIYINNKAKLDKIKLTKDNFYVVADFDKTITEGFSVSTWGVMAHARNVAPDYTQRRTALYNHYRPIEIDSTISDEEKSKEMSDWWNAHIALFYEYELKEGMIEEAVERGNLKYREGAKEFLKRMYDLNIPVIIVSAGIGNVITKFLKDNGDFYSNIKIISNFIEFENGKIKKLSSEPIHALNKNIVKLDEESKKQIENKDYILLLGDGLADLKMVSNEDIKRAITVGFLDEKVEENLEYFNKEFDIVITDNGSFQELNKVFLRKKYINIRNNIQNKKEKSRIIMNKVIDTDEYKSAKTLALYKSLDSEVDTSELIKYSFETGKIVALPRVEGDEIKFYRIKSFDETMEKSKFGVEEPIENKENFITKEDIDLVVVPGVCFDMNGGRMGFGKGYYDRYLKDTTLKTIGICFKEQITDKVPLSPNDVIIQKIITD